MPPDSSLSEGPEQPLSVGWSLHPFPSSSSLFAHSFARGQTPSLEHVLPSVGYSCTVPWQLDCAVAIPPWLAVQQHTCPHSLATFPVHPLVLKKYRSQSSFDEGLPSMF